MTVVPEIQLEGQDQRKCCYSQSSRTLGLCPVCKAGQGDVAEDYTGSRASIVLVLSAWFVGGFIVHCTNGTVTLTVLETRISPTLNLSP